MAPALLVTACMSSSYSVARDELQRLSRLPPEQRWPAVRATQRIFASDAPPEPTTVLPASTEPVFVPGVILYDNHSYVIPGSWRGGYRVNTTGAPRGAGSSSTSGRSSSSGSSGSGGGRDGAAVVVVIVVAAAVIVFVLAATEGARYDGWLALPPDEAVYVDEPDGTIVAVPLSGLTPELADFARGATVYEGERDRYLRLGRAPLNRVGLTVQSAVTTSMLPSVHGAVPAGFGFGGHAFFGGYFVQQLGVGVTADVMAGTNSTLLAGVGGEVQVMPFTWAGAYLGGGWMSVHDDNPPSQSASAWYLRAGLRGELPLTTRLSAGLRLGVSRVDAGTLGALYVPEASLGLSVY